MIISHNKFASFLHFVSSSAGRITESDGKKFANSPPPPPPPQTDENRKVKVK